MYDALEVLARVIADAPADEKTRAAWLDRLFEAHAADQIPYIEGLAEFWGELCGSPETASAWADQLLDITRQVVGGGRNPGDHFHGATACLSALLRAERFEELIDLLEGEKFWGYKKWKVRALDAMGRSSEAILYAEACRDPWASDFEIDTMCEEILFAGGFVEDAYTRYGLRSNRRGTYLATFRAVSKKYPHKTPTEVLSDLVETTPGEEGKWFAAAKQAGLYDEALALARESPCDPKTLATWPKSVLVLQWRRASFRSPDSWRVMAMRSSVRTCLKPTPGRWRRRSCVAILKKRRRGSGPSWRRSGGEIGLSRGCWRGNSICEMRGHIVEREAELDRYDKARESPRAMREMVFRESDRGESQR